MGPIPEGSLSEASRYLDMLRNTQQQMSFLDSFLQDERAAPYTPSGRIPSNIATSQARATIPTDATYTSQRTAPISKLVQERQMLANREAILRAAHALNSPAWNLPNTLPKIPGGVTPEPPGMPPSMLSRLSPFLTGLELLGHHTPLNVGEQDKLDKLFPKKPDPLQMQIPTQRPIWSLF